MAAALVRAKSIDEPALIARALCLKARADVFRGRIEEGIAAAEEAIGILSTVGLDNPSTLAGIASEAWRTAGRAFFKLGNLAEAFPRLENAVAIAEAALDAPTGKGHRAEIGVSAVTAFPRALHDLGVAFMAVREIEEAIETCARGIAAADAHPDVYRLIPDDMLLLLTAWAGALQQRHRNQRASQAGISPADDDLARAGALLADRAKPLIDMAERAAAEDATPLSGYGYQSYYGALGRQLLLSGDAVGACAEFERQLAQGVAVGNAAVAACAEIGIADALLTDGNYASALPHARAAIDRLAEDDEADVRADALLALSRIYSGLGEDRPALEALLSYNSVRDRLHAKEAKLHASYLASRIGLARARAEADAQRRIAADLAGLNAKLEQQAAALSKQSVELDMALRVAEAANRAKSVFLANMSHELRTPLNAVLGFSELMQMLSKEPVIVGYARDIHDSGSHLLAIINDILDLSRIEAGKVELDIETIMLAELFADCRKFVAEKAAKIGLTIAMSVGEGAETVRADVLRLRQILINLLSNAIKFTQSGGTVTLSASASADGDILVAVADTGLGMTPEEIEIALQPFGMVDNSLTRGRQGTGLGLPLATRLAELHGGSLSVESEPGHGTRVAVLLPQS